MATPEDIYSAILASKPVIDSTEVDIYDAKNWSQPLNTPGYTFRALGRTFADISDGTRYIRVPFDSVILIQVFLTSGNEPHATRLVLFI